MTNKEFINTIAPVIRKIALSRGYQYPSAIIAQACNESAYGRSSLGKKYNNFFGMKCGKSWHGKSVNLSTKEEYTVGTLTEIKDNFRVYDSVEDGVLGYFDFIKSSRYSNLKDANSSKNYLELIKSDGYATSADYVKNVYSVVISQDLLRFDTTSSQLEPTKTIDEIANEVIHGEWGCGQDRRNRLESNGYSNSLVQSRVNEILNSENKSKTIKSNEQIAKEVIRGDWGNGLERKQRLTGCGYNYKEIQKIVNSMV